jgi:hypothetical protein
MTDDDPVPLKAGGEASPELVRALYQLGKRGPADAARLERVAKKLEAALAEAPQPGAASEGFKLLGAKTIVTGIVIGVAALAWLGYQYVRSSVDNAPPASAPQPQVVAPPVVPPPPATPAATDAPAPRVTPAPTETSSPRAVPQSAPRRGGRHSASSSSSSRTSGSGLSTQGVTSSGMSEAEAKVAPAPAAQEQLAKPAQAKQTAEPEEPPSLPQRSEVGLLFDARKAMPSQPLAALRLLEEHAQRFPDGQLGPEREVLRIEALRKLGRTAEANERMRAFEARYPKSIHLRRLKEQAESAPSR